MEKPSVPSRGRFKALRIGLAIVLLITETVVAIAVLSTLGIARSNVPGIVGGFAVANLILARLGADRVFKWLGCSQSGRFRETNAKMLANPEGFVASKLIFIVPVFKDAFGTDLMKLDLTGTRVEDQERLVRFIKARLPKAKLELEV